ncbi:MAG: thioredoxin family protein [Firmicutes bacterium]|nr:thioredoxin family protein [Bacillota bacterium]
MQTILTYQDLQKIIKNQIVVIIAKTKTCNVCVPISNRLEELMSSYQNVPLFQLYLEDILEFQGQFLIFTVPTIVIFSESKEILRESRFIDFTKIDRLLSIYTT